MVRSYQTLAGLMGVVLSVHLFVGGPEYATPYRQQLDPHLASMAVVLWHGVSVTLGLLICAYLWLARHADTALLAFTSALQLGWAALFVAFGIAMLGEVYTMPQWVLFTAFPAAALWIARRDPRRAVAPQA